MDKIWSDSGVPNFIRNRDQPTLGQWDLIGECLWDVVLLSLFFDRFSDFALKWLGKAPNDVIIGDEYYTPRHPTVTAGPILGETFLFV